MESGNGNVQDKVDFGDVEGVWTYVYFSYSSTEQQAVSWVKYQREEAVSLSFKVKHEVPSYLRFILGGQEGDQYPGFNGQFSQPVLRLGAGSFLKTQEEFKFFTMKCNPRPKPLCFVKNIVKIVKDRESY